MSAIGRVLKRIADVGGPGAFLNQMIREGRVYSGTLVGVDKAGNKYYENNEDYVYGAHRWVDYKSRNDFDASDIDAEWHAWMHKMTDDKPTPPKHRWQVDYVPNKTGTSEEYVPYSTVKPKIQAWKP